MSQNRRSFLSSAVSAAGAFGLASIPAAVQAATAPRPSYFTPPADFPVMALDVRSKLADLFLTLETLDVRLDACIEEFNEGGEYSLELFDCIEAQAIGRTYTDIIGGIIGDAPSTLSEHVLNTLAKYENQNRRNTPHVEAVSVLLLLARKLVGEAKHLAWDPVERTADYDLLMAAAQSFQATQDVISGSTFSGHWSEEILTAILAGDAIPEHEAMRAEFLAERAAKA